MAIETKITRTAQAELLALPPDMQQAVAGLIAHEELRAKAVSDGERLRWLMAEDLIPEAIVGVDFDRYEYMAMAHEARCGKGSHEESSEEDELNGVRLFLDAAMRLK